ncbi:MAG: hypothetical protein AAFZ65_08715 [Planctomycetota bacterium]
MFSRRTSILALLAVVSTVLVLFQRGVSAGAEGTPWAGYRVLNARTEGVRPLEVRSLRLTPDRDPQPLRARYEWRVADGAWQRLRVPGLVGAEGSERFSESGEPGTVTFARSTQGAGPLHFVWNLSSESGARIECSRMAGDTVVLGRTLIAAWPDALGGLSGPDNSPDIQWEQDRVVVEERLTFTDGTPLQLRMVLEAIDA